MRLLYGQKITPSFAPRYENETTRTSFVSKKTPSRRTVRNTTTISGTRLTTTIDVALRFRRRTSVYMYTCRPKQVAGDGGPVYFVPFASFYVRNVHARPSPDSERTVGVRRVPFGGPKRTRRPPPWPLSPINRPGADDGRR